MDLAPIVTNDFDGWKVSLMQNGRLQVYLCATENAALRFARCLAQPLVDKKTRAARPARASRWSERLLSVAGL